jgi:hypothetical protein
MLRHTRAQHTPGTITNPNSLLTYQVVDGDLLDDALRVDDE